MTEEEMLDLAMRLSAQEANSAAQKRQQEDNNIQKAIADSLDVGETFVLIKAVMHYMTFKIGTDFKTISIVHFCNLLLEKTERHTLKD